MPNEKLELYKYIHSAQETDWVYKYINSTIKMRVLTIQHTLFRLVWVVWIFGPLAPILESSSINFFYYHEGHRWKISTTQICVVHAAHIIILLIGYQWNLVFSWITSQSVQSQQRQSQQFCQHLVLFTQAVTFFLMAFKEVPKGCL